MNKTQNIPEIEYRTETAYGSGTRNIIDVMNYEIFELFNTDIIDYVLTRHNSLLSEKTKHMLQKDIEDITDENDQKEFCTSIISDINNASNRSYKYALWLCERNAVKQLYLNDDYTEQNIDAYAVSDMIISDLGFDGRLYVYEDMPERLNNIE